MPVSLNPETKFENQELFRNFSFSSLPILWTKETHTKWSLDFGKIVYYFILCVRLINKEKKNSFLFPKVLIFEIISNLSLFY
jgi:hypothetical protein